MGPFQEGSDREAYQRQQSSLGQASPKSLLPGAYEDTAGD